MLSKLKRFFKKEKGQGLVEYGLILALISVLSIGAVSSVGKATKDTFDGVTDTLNTHITTPESEFVWVPYDGSGSYEVTNEEGLGYYHYIGTDTVVIPPHTINGHLLTRYSFMYRDTNVEKVVSTNRNIDHTTGMFYNSTAETLDVSQLYTGNVQSMASMFSGIKARSLNLGDFDTHDVINMSYMFQGIGDIDLKLTTFDTGKVVTAGGMFLNSQVKSLDLSSFDTQTMDNMLSMFQNSKAKVVYTKTQSDKDRFTALTTNPAELEFIVKGGN